MAKPREKTFIPKEFELDNMLRREKGQFSRILGNPEMADKGLFRLDKFGTLESYVFDETRKIPGPELDDMWLAVPRTFETFARCPFGDPGDHLWIREAWADTNGENGPMISYRLRGDRFLVDESYPVDYSLYPGCNFTMWCGDLRRGEEGHHWRRATAMPRWASRLTLLVVDRKVQRLHDAEPEFHGFLGDEDKTAHEYFHEAWDRVFGPTAALNPWVFTVDWRHLEGPRA